MKQPTAAEISDGQWRVHVLRVRRGLHDLLERAYWQPDYLSERGKMKEVRAIIELQTRVDAGQAEHMEQAVAEGKSDEELDSIWYASEDQLTRF